MSKTKEEKMTDAYLKCSKCSHENFIDEACEVLPESYTCDECGKPLAGEAKAVLEKPE